MHDVYISLGGNQGDPLSCFVMTLRHFQHLGIIRRCSGIYQTEPQGGPLQSDYLNAVFLLSTDKTCDDVLRQAWISEKLCGRVRTVRFGPRSLDVDILLYDDLVLETENLLLPHPRMHLRRFVLEPLEEISPKILIPGKGDVRTLLQGIRGQRVTRVKDWKPELLESTASQDW
ncbi:MAG: 2-amino-4-hydroxy-6-hydroxymethyldihydropteridine diphosphokinase [Firmicutes bacterium]|nr:2-amino-4-hydroxy-6-hydroxymethyldihydropteridine diphosphokinase [Bacillota bacterium]